MSYILHFFVTVIVQSALGRKATQMLVFAIVTK
jgi:hypothetical protein